MVQKTSGPNWTATVVRRLFHVEETLVLSDPAPARQPLLGKEKHENENGKGWYDGMVMTIAISR